VQGVRQRRLVAVRTTARKGQSVIPHVLERFASVRRRPSAPRPTWIDDAIWIVAAMRSPATGRCQAKRRLGPHPARSNRFSRPSSSAPMHCFRPASKVNCATISSRPPCGPPAFAARTTERLCAAALYELFIKALKSRDKEAAATSRYDQFIADMKDTACDACSRKNQSCYDCSRRSHASGSRPGASLSFVSTTM